MPRVELSCANIMFAYNNVLKCPDAYILDRLCKVYHNKYESYINFSNLDTLSPDAMMPFIASRPKKNLLEWLAIKEFNYEKNYDMLFHKWIDMYERSAELNMYKIAKKFVRSYCINNIYIYNPEYDKRQHFDIINHFSKNQKVQYCTGEIQDVIDKIGNLNVFYDWDIDRVKKLVDSGVNEDTLIAIATYGFNLDDNGLDLKYNLSRSSQIATFTPYTYNENSKYFG